MLSFRTVIIVIIVRILIIIIVILIIIIIDVAAKQISIISIMLNREFIQPFKCFIFKKPSFFVIALDGNLFHLQIPFQFLKE